MEGSWELAFEDDFTSGKLDSTLWLNTLPWGRHPESGFKTSLDFNTNGTNFYFSDGILRISVDNKSVFEKAVDYLDSSFILKDGLPNLRWWPYTSGILYSKQSFGYGKFEIRCKIPKGRGIVSSFWLFGQNGSDRNEIDVFEFWNERTLSGKYDPDKLSRVHQMTIHYKDRMCNSDYLGPDFSADFHTFTLVWDNFKIEWYVDGQLKRRSMKFYTIDGKEANCETLSEGDRLILNATYPLDPLLHIIAGPAVHSHFNAPDSETEFPQYFDVDYIRFYKKK